ncbi:MAG: hypothetical protein AAF483_03660 [Planctomycetota bacterium]
MGDTDKSIRERKTVKVLADNDLATPGGDFDSTIRELLDLAGMAPFHRPCHAIHQEGDLQGIEPWRFYVLAAAECRALGPSLDPGKAGKIPKMLAAADSLVICTWLPNPSGNDAEDQEELFEPTMANMEHIAAASAAIQNLLIAATDRGIANYWSSGGVLRGEEFFTRCGIPAGEILLGAIFLFPTETGEAQVVESNLRTKRTAADQWSKCLKA